MVSAGTINVVASVRVTTRYLYGSTAETSIASICSVTFIDPSSAPMLDPTLPAAISAVTSGASDRISAIAISDGNHEVAPNAASDGRDCFVNTTPVTNPVSVISGI